MSLQKYKTFFKATTRMSIRKGISLHLLFFYVNLAKLKALEGAQLRCVLEYRNHFLAKGTPWFEE